MTAVIKACGVIIVGLFAAILFRDNQKYMRFAAVSCVFLSVAVFFTGGGFSDSLTALSSSAEKYFPESAEIMVKALGISYITAITGELCTSAGEDTLANAAAFAGKVQIIVLCLPLISQLLKIAGDTL